MGGYRLPGQIKVGRGYRDPAQVPESMTRVRMQGSAPGARRGCEQPARDAVTDFLGAYLRDLYPAIWK